MRHTRSLPHFPPRRLPRDARGFTILEVALASFVMALGISSAILAMQSSFRFLDVARDTTLTSQILQSEIERIRMMSWASVSTLPAEETVNLSTMFTADANLAARFTVTRKVVKDDDRENDVRLITLSVKWTSYDGRSHSRRFQTKYVKNGLYDYYYTLARP